MRAEAAYRYGKSYELVWWIRAEEPATLASDYRALAGALHLVRAEGPSGWAEGLQEWLRQRSHWLLEFDDAQGPAQVRPYLPAGAGHVTVTSRNPVWQGMGNVLTVPVLPRDEAAAFLLAEPGSLTR